MSDTRFRLSRGSQARPLTSSPALWKFEPGCQSAALAPRAGPSLAAGGHCPVAFCIFGPAPFKGGSGRTCGRTFRLKRDSGRTGRTGRTFSQSFLRGIRTQPAPAVRGGTIGGRCGRKIPRDLHSPLLSKPFVHFVSYFAPVLGIGSASGRKFDSHKRSFTITSLARRTSPLSTFPCLPPWLHRFGLCRQSSSSS
jgi:hypothetical protein